MKAYNVHATGVIDFTVMANSEEEAIANIKARFHRTNPHDEMHMEALPNGGRILGIKTESYEAETWD